VGSLEESMQQLGQFAAAKRSIQAKVEGSTAEAERSHSSLSLLSARKADRDSMRTERASAVRPSPFSRNTNCTALMSQHQLHHVDESTPTAPR
jgi:hypothetical protein